MEKETQELHNLPDEEVLVRSLKNPELFAVVYDRYSEAFLRKAKAILGNEDDAYDVVQETFVRIYSSAKQFRKQEGASFKSWGYKILINQCFTLYKRRKRTGGLSLDGDDELAEFIPDLAEREGYENKLTKDYLMSLVSRLPAMLGRVVRLHFIEDLPQKDIAKIEGVSDEVVRVRIHRAKHELRKIKSGLNI